MCTGLDALFKFEDVVYSVPDKKTGTKTILNGISGECRSGGVLAILGPSGAGKTTLIDLLTLEPREGTSVGKVTINGNVMTKEMFTEYCATVPQVDRHWGFLTCREVVQNAADLYINASAAEKADRVETLLKAMGLAECANTVCGNIFATGLSGGQKRRLSIALALLKSPLVLFLDEPTSGLDAAAAANIMAFITQLAKATNICVVCTIHQPSASVYADFDRVMLLSSGRVAYQGEAAAVYDYFAGIGYPVPDNMSAAEFMLDLVNREFTDPAKVDDVLDKYKNITLTEMEEPIAPRDIGVPFIKQVAILTKRHGLLSLRDPLYYTGRLAMFAIFLIFFAIMYYKSIHRTQDQAVARMWLMLWHIGIPSNLGVVAVYVYNGEFLAIRREVKNGMVNPVAYYLANLLIQIPMMVVAGVTTTAVSGFGQGGWYGHHYIEIVLIWSCMLWAFEAGAQVMSLVSTNPLVGMMGYIVYWFSSFLFCGILVNNADVPWPLRIMTWTLPIKWSIRGMAKMEFDPATHYAGAHLANNSYGFTCDAGQSVCLGYSGDQVLNSIGSVFHVLTTQADAGGEAGLLIAIAVFLKLVHMVMLVSAAKASKLVQVPDPKAPAQAPASRPVVVELPGIAPHASTPDLTASNAASQLGIARGPDTLFKFEDVVYSVPDKKTGTKTILKGISGECRSGGVLAILGPSGAGKTTLIDLLTLEPREGTSVGKVTINGNVMTKEMFTEYCATVPQVDRHWGFLTCREVVQNAADLYINASAAEKADRVETLLKAMGLAECANTVCGNIFATGLSGGQKRRLSIALALLKSPLVLFLDEPTSGLDAAAAANIMAFITQLAKATNICVVCTIHQPSASVYADFDRVMLLSSGRVAYQGEAAAVYDYFAGIGYPVPDNMSAAEFMLDLVNREFTDPAKVDDVLDKYKNITLTEMAVQPIAPRPCGVGFLKQSVVLIRRHSVLALRDPTLYTGRIIGNMFMCLYFSAVYYKSRDRVQEQVPPRMWHIMWHLTATTLNCVIATYSYSEEFPSLRREVKNGMIAPASYLIANALIQIPAFVIMSLFAVSVSGFGVGLFNGANYIEIILVWAVNMWAFEAAAQFCSLTSKLALMGMLNYMQFWFTAMLFCGNLINLNDVPWPFKILTWCLPLKWSLRTFVTLEMSSTTYYKGAQVINGTVVCDAKYVNQPCYGYTGQQAMDGMHKVRPPQHRLPARSLTPLHA